MDQTGVSWNRLISSRRQLQALQERQTPTVDSLSPQGGHLPLP
jgi:hypothetical protein